MILNTVNIRDKIIGGLELELYIDEQIFTKFDKLGCQYLKNVDIEGEIYDRVYRRNNIFYPIGYDYKYVYLYDENFVPILESSYMNLHPYSDNGYICSHCDKVDINQSHIYLLHSSLISKLNEWLELPDFKTTEKRISKENRKYDWD
jgi:NAD+--asparagine ADP-ribosyltransferase